MARRFIYRASAVAAGGQLFAPAPAPIPLQAPLVLPVGGGAATADSHDFRLGGLISFRRAATRVAGGPLADGRGWGTLSEAIVEGLSLLEGRVTIEHMTGRLTSRHPTEPNGPVEGSIWTVGTRLQGLCIDGKPVQFTDESGTFTTLDTLESIGKAFAERGSAFHTLAMKEFFWGGGAPADAPEELQAVAAACQPHARKSAAPVLRGLVPCSVVSGVRVARDARLRVWGNWIGVPGVGRLQLGELLVGESYRRLTLLRVELDTSYVPPSPARVGLRAKKGDEDTTAPDLGEMNFGGVETDGTPHP